MTAVLSNHTTPCDITSRPSLVAMEMHILAYFGAGITMSSWVWNGSTRDSWKRFIHRLVIFVLMHSVLLQAEDSKVDDKTSRGVGMQVYRRPLYTAVLTILHFYGPFCKATNYSIHPSGLVAVIIFQTHHIIFTLKLHVH